MHICCKNCKKHTDNTFPKKLILILENKFKIKSKCGICLNKRTFIHEIEGKYDLESEFEIHLQFFVDWCYKTRLRLIPWSVGKILKILTQKWLKQKMVDYLCSQNLLSVEFKSQDL